MTSSTEGARTSITRNIDSLMRWGLEQLERCLPRQPTGATAAEAAHVEQLNVEDGELSDTEALAAYASGGDLMIDGGANCCISANPRSR